MADENDADGADATFDKHMGNFLREQGSEGAEAPAAGTEAPPATEGAEAEAATEGERPEGAPEASEPKKPDLVEREWYGKKRLMDRETAEDLDRFFTQRNQEIAAMRKQLEGDLQEQRRVVEAEKAKVGKWREQLNQWAKQRPEIGSLVEQKALQEELSGLKSRLESYEQAQQEKAAETALLEACAETDAKVKLPDQIPLSNQDFRRLYMQEFMDNEGQISVQEAAMLVRDRLAQGLKKANAGKVQELADKRRQQAGTKPLAGQPTSGIKPMDTRELIKKYGAKAAWDHIGRLAAGALPHKE